MLAGFVLTSLSLPLFNDLSGKQLQFSLDAFSFLAACILLVVIGVMAGGYPAFVLSAFKPAKVLRGNDAFLGGGAQKLRMILTNVQLVLAIALIFSTLMIRQQPVYLQDKDLGFNKTQLIVVPLYVPHTTNFGEKIASGFQQLMRLFKATLLRRSGIAGILTTSHDFGNGDWISVGYTDDDDVYRTFHYNTVDANYLEQLKISVLYGRSFIANNASDYRHSIIVNEAFVNMYGWDDLIGKRIPAKGFEDHEIIGVVKDFHYACLYEKVQPLVMAMNPALVFSGSEHLGVDNSPIPKLLIRISPRDIAKTLEDISRVWHTITGGHDFNFSFADVTVAVRYARDRNLGRMITIATVLSILIDSLGLYGLVSLTMQGRVREISIRKILGASASFLLMLLSHEYIVLVLVWGAIVVIVF